jgi:transcriptional regulator GlxA family with amidase domain
LIGFDGVQGLDIVGPADAFAIASVAGKDGKPEPCYEVIIVGLSDKPFRAESGLLFHPHTTLREAPLLDTLIIPGGKGCRVDQTGERIANWVGAIAHKTRRIASVCTGAYPFARTGLLNGRRVTTHWRFAQDLAGRFPKLNVDPNRLFLKEGRFYTAGGITASIDLALALIEEDHGSRVALTVARELVVYLKRPGGQQQFSEPLQFQVNSDDRFADLVAWMVGHLAGDLSLGALAKRACLSPRHFARRFKKTFGGTPAAFVENLRLDEARRRLTERRQTIETVAMSVGFKSDDAFRLAFQRHFGVKPNSYRQHFEATDNRNLAVATRGEKSPTRGRSKARGA